MQNFKLTRVTAIAAGVIISLIVIAGGLLTYFTVFSSASNAVPTDVVVTATTSQSGIITWVTGEETQGTIEYGTSPAELGFYAPEALKSTNHRVELSLLQPDTTYYFIIRAGDSVFDNGGVPWTFTTKPVEVEEEATPEAEVIEIAELEEEVASLEAEVEEGNLEEGEATATVTPRTPTASPSPTRRPAVTIRSSTPTFTPIPTKIACTSTNCTAIAGYLGPGKCSVQDYFKCLYKKISPTITPSISVTPTGAPVETPSLVEANLNAGGTAIIVTFSGKNNVFAFEVERYSSGDPTPTVTAIVSTVSPTGGWSLIREILGPDINDNGATNYSFTDTNVSSGVQYRYRVRAKDGTTYSNYGPGTSGTFPIITVP